MAAKPHPPFQDNTGSSALAQFPPLISLASPVLASVISLPDRPLIAYTVFHGAPSTNAADHLNLIELARRRILLQNSQRGILDSLLPSVHITKDISVLYVFAIGSADRTSEAHTALAALEFEGLSLTESSTFTPSSIYPCSVTCSTEALPCPQCLNLSAAVARSATSSAHLLPRRRLRLPFHYFLVAVRDRLIDDITEASKLSPSSRQTTRLKGGFVLGPTPASSEWSTGWEHSVRNRPLIFCHLQVHLSQTSSTSARILIHPVMRPTFYLPMFSIMPLPSGTPITLLPHGVPAYYLNTYNGPASALTSQFKDALAGFGAGDWQSKPARDGRSSGIATASSTSMDEESPAYIIAWLSVQNKQGEDKGMPIIWPLRLCLSYHPSSPSPHARTPLLYNPELPAQLQASPPPPPPPVPLNLSSVKSSTSMLRESSTRPRSPSHQTQSNTPADEQLSASILRRPRTSTSSPTSDSLRAFRSLTLTTLPYVRGMEEVAVEVSGYVNSVAKERERERERMKREREGTHVRGRAASISVAGSATNTQTTSEQPTSNISNLEPSKQLADLLPEARPEKSSSRSPMEQDEEPPFLSSQESSNSLFSPAADENTPSLPDDGMQISVEVKTEVGPIDIGDIPGPSESHAAGSLPDVVSLYDPFSGYDTSWPPESSNDFMEMNMGYDMGFSMNIDSIGDARSRERDAGGFDMDDGFGVFTDDDFSFFDGPTAPARATVAPIQIDNAMKASEGLTPAAGPAPLGLSPQRLGDVINLSGPGPPSVTLTQPSPWAPHFLAEGFTPRALSLQYLAGNIPPAPDLIPPSPSKTPSSHSAPATPTVQLSDQHEAAEGHKLSHHSLGPSVFDPIPFASSHRDADGKYAIGKFAMSSPPDQEDRTESVFLSSSPPAMSGWKYRYNAATDPRIGVMRKLIGVKRKSFDQGMREVRMSPSWLKEHEEWESNTSSPWTEDAKSDVDSEEEPWMDDDDTATILRPSTPPPSYLPMGPTLLQTHFHHSRLLPLSSPLRPPGALVSSSLGSGAPISVPTPVSPAAVLGAASEKSKSLEAAAQILVREIVENSAWAEAWRANAAASSVSFNPPTEVWQTDIKRVCWLLRDVRAMRSPIDIETLLGLDDGLNSPSAPIQSLESPMLSVGKSESVIQVLPSALRFWEKLGLAPRAGEKHVTVFAFYEGATHERENQIVQWLDKVSKAYTARNFGTHVVGSSSCCSRPGLVPVRFDQLKKTLVNFIATLSLTPETNLIIFLITPSTMIAPTSPTLRQLFSAVKRALKSYSHLGILFHLVPEALTTGGLSDPRAGHGGLGTFVASLYDRILQPVERYMSRKLFPVGARTRTSFHAPAFALACAFPSVVSTHSIEAGPRVTYALESHPSSLDVVNRYTLLHVGYQMSACGRWLFAACVDGHGEEYDLGAWLVPGESIEAFVVNQIWSFARAFATRANVEWRIVLTKLGMLGENELDTWMNHLNDITSTPCENPPMHVTLLAAEHENAWTFLAPTDDTPSKTAASFNSSRSSPRASSSAVLADITSRTYALFLPANLLCIPVINPITNWGFGPGSTDLPFIPDCEDDESLQPQACFRVRRMSSLICASGGTDFTSIHMLNIYQLHSICSPSCSAASSLTALHDMNDRVAQAEGFQKEEEQTLRDITSNFHSLATLTRLKWRSHQMPGLPLHLAALEVMRTTLAGDSTDT